MRDIKSKSYPSYFNFSFLRQPGMSFFILSEGWRNWGFNKLDSIVQSYNNIVINKEEVMVIPKGKLRLECLWDVPFFICMTVPLLSMIDVLYCKREFGLFLQRILQNLFPETVYSKVLTKTQPSWFQKWQKIESNDSCLNCPPG